MLAAYDITIYDSAGKEFQPQEGVITVEIVNTEVAQAVNSDEEISVYHMETAGAVPQEVAGVQPTASGVTFDAEGFSIYVVTMPETHFTVTYNFYAAWGAGEPLNTQILSQGKHSRSQRVQRIQLIRCFWAGMMKKAIGSPTLEKQRKL